MRECVEFNGRVYSRDPNAKQRSNRVYFRPASRADRDNGVKCLHVEIWKATNGRDVPDGHFVHHIDGDPLNNDPSNLDCIERGLHTKIHMQEIMADPARRREFFEKVNAYAQTPEGHARRAELSRRASQSRPKVERACERCGHKFVTVITWARFCSPKCRYAARDALRATVKRRLRGMV